MKPLSGSRCCNSLTDKRSEAWYSSEWRKRKQVVQGGKNQAWDGKNQICVVSVSVQKADHATEAISNTAAAEST